MVLLIKIILSAQTNQILKAVRNKYYRYTKWFRTTHTKLKNKRFQIAICLLIFIWIILKPRFCFYILINWVDFPRIKLTAQQRNWENKMILITELYRQTVMTSLIDSNKSFMENCSQIKTPNLRLRVSFFNILYWYQKLPDNRQPFLQSFHLMHHQPPCDRKSATGTFSDGFR